MPPDSEGPGAANSVQADTHADAFAGSPRLKKLVGLFAPFFDIVAGWLGQLAATLRLSALSAFLIRRLAKRPGQIGAELFVAAALSVTFAELIGPTSQPHPDGDAIPIVTFWYLGQHAKMEARDLIMLAWRKRLAGPALSSWLVDATHKDGHVSDADFQALFEFYHAGWLFLLFLALICLRKDALVIMLGVFAGLTYNMTDYVHGLCYYPWDMPNMFWFTLAWLLYDSKKIWPFLAACCVGGLFKETSLFCALLVLFHQGWGWPKRISGFLGTVIVCFGIDKLMQIHYHVKAPTFAMNNTTSHFDQIFNNAIPENMSYLFSLEPHHVLFSNAGAILIVMLLPWRNYRDFTFKVLLTAFIVCEFCYGITIEVRVWYEILPLVWALVSEAMTGRFALNSGDPVPLPGVRRFLAGSYWAMIAALLGLAIAYTSVHPSYKAGQAALAAGNETNVDYLIDQS